MAGREVRITHPRKPYFSREVRLSKLDLRPVLPLRRGRRARGHPRPPLVLKRFVDGAEGEVFYQKRAPKERPPWLRTATLSFPSGRTARRGRRRRRRGPRLGREPRLHRAPSPPGALGRARAPRRAARRSRPGARAFRWGDVRRVALEVEALLGRWPDRLAEDERLARHARERAHRAALDLHRGPARGARALARGRAARARARDLEVVEGGAPRRVPRLQPEREGPHDLLRVLGAPAARRARVDAALVERGARVRARGLHPAHGARAASPSAATRTPGSTPPPARSRPCSSSRPGTRRRASAATPWPPHYRKAAGEAARVAPSRAKGAARAPRAKMPLVVVARSPSREAALAGLERWKARHPEAAARLAVDDVLVDSMRGRSSTWTRIRVNLRHAAGGAAPAAGDRPIPTTTRRASAPARRAPKRGA